MHQIKPCSNRREKDWTYVRYANVWKGWVLFGWHDEDEERANQIDKSAENEIESCWWGCQFNAYLHGHRVAKNHPYVTDFNSEVNPTSPSHWCQRLPDFSTKHPRPRRKDQINWKPNRQGHNSRRITKTRQTWQSIRWDHHQQNAISFWALNWRWRPRKEWVIPREAWPRNQPTIWLKPIRRRIRKDREKHR